MALAETLQDDFGFGIFRGRKSPANAVYDVVNGLVDDEANLFKPRRVGVLHVCRPGLRDRRPR